MRAYCFIRSLVKDTVFASARHLGINRLLRTKVRRNLLILCYHGVVSEDHPEDPYRYRVAVSVREFRSHLNTVARLLNPVSAWDVLDWLAGTASLPPNPVLITFDDGFRNNLTYAVPELERVGIPALINIATGYIGQKRLLWSQELDERILGWECETLPMPDGQRDVPMPSRPAGRVAVAQQVGSLCKQIPTDLREAYLDRLRNEPLPYGEDRHRELYDFLTWDEVRVLSQRGFAIGSHTVNHPVLTRLSGKALERELCESKAAVERELQTQCPWIAYPCGGPDDVSPEVVFAAKQAGYRVGFTLTDRFSSVSDDPLMIDRICVPVGLSENAFHARISGLSSLLRQVVR